MSIADDLLGLADASVPFARSLLPFYAGRVAQVETEIADLRNKNAELRAAVDGWAAKCGEVRRQADARCAQTSDARLEDAQAEHTRAIEDMSARLARMQADRDHLARLLGEAKEELESELATPARGATVPGSRGHGP